MESTRLDITCVLLSAQHIQGAPGDSVLVRDAIHLVSFMDDLWVKGGDNELGWIAGIICLLC